jgi:hypothetical protein
VIDEGLLMNAVSILRDIRVREANLLRLISEASKSDKAIASAFFNYSFDVQERLRKFDSIMQTNLIEAFYENTSSLFKLHMSIEHLELSASSETKIDYGSNVKSLTPQGRLFFEIRAEERKILMLMRELAVTWPDTLKVCCGVADADIKKLREISVDCLLELAFQHSQGTIFRLKFDTKKMVDELMSWLYQPVAVGLFLDKAS